MSEKQETIAEIIAEMRKPHEEICAKCHEEPNESCPYCGDPNGCNSPDCGRWPGVMTQFADRIEAAQKREVGNGAKMYEVVELLARVILPPQEEYPAEYGGGKVPDKDGWLAWIRQVQSYAKSALAAPPRNCDMGTVDEQTGRFADFARLAFQSEVVRCAMNWAQLPYEEGGAK